MKYEIKSLKKGAKLVPKLDLVKKNQAGSKVKPVLLKGPTITPKYNYTSSEPIKSRTDLDAKGNFVNTGNYKTVVPKKTKVLASKKEGGTLDISNILSIWKK